MSSTFSSFFWIIFLFFSGRPLQTDTVWKVKGQMLKGNTDWGHMTHLKTQPPFFFICQTPAVSWYASTRHDTQPFNTPQKSNVNIFTDSGFCILTIFCQYDASQMMQGQWRVTLMGVEEQTLHLLASYPTDVDICRYVFKLFNEPELTSELAF